ncbi:MAG: Na+/H+ antiporter subunit E [Lachnospiraceae bacterium]|nr:Na+/H+ antiporter subunit E [Lachnospiraceae bacterium]
MYIGLLLLWIVLNGKFTLEILLFGMVICGAIYAFCCKIFGLSIQRDLSLMKRIPLAVQYVIILIIEILKANRQVLRFIMTPQLQVEPVIVHFHSSLKSDISRVILANSITLTPGTITVRLEGDEYYVHCLDKDFAEGMDASIFVKLLEKMEAVK